MNLDNYEELSTEQLAQLAGVELLGRPRTNAEAAQVLGLKPNTLEIKRTHGGGPPYIQNEPRGRVMYLERDLLMWLFTGRRRHSSESRKQLAAA